ncbi:MAG: PLP-dependent aminotransferase family protein [Bacteroidota bacterium]
MLPYKTLLALDRAARRPLYLQITKALIRHISAGVIGPGTKLPGSRRLATMLAVNRRTVAAAYEELEAQGWVEVRPNQGCFVRDTLPLVRGRALSTLAAIEAPQAAHFPLRPASDLLIEPHLPRPTGTMLTLSDGHPDVQLAPMKELAKNFSFILNHPGTHSLMNYTQSFRGDRRLREVLITYLAETRGLRISLDHIVLTRGSLMAFYLLGQTLLAPGDAVIVGEPGYNEGHNTLTLAGGRLLRVPVDEDGLDVDAVEALCRTHRVRAVYTVPHHHYPTTVSLSAARRMRLLALAEAHRLAIIEDDYDYDFHYAGSPILPMASSDYAGVVAYVGSLSKIIAPSLRLGFIVGPPDLITAVTQRSRFLDSFGNTALERAVAMLFESGSIRRYLKKAVRTYAERRDVFCQALQRELGPYATCTPPEGGLAAWVRLDESVPLEAVVAEAAARGVRLPDRSFFCGPGQKLNATRMGFASLTPAKMERALAVLRASLEAVQQRS